MSQPLIAVTSGEPAGIGPELCLKLADWSGAGHPVVLGDRDLLAARAAALGWPVALRDYTPGQSAVAGHLDVLHLPLAKPAQAGLLDPANGPYVLSLLDRALFGCQRGEFAAIATAPVHKGVINQAGVQQVAQALADAVLDLTKGEGDWAILSATSTASNQNAWIEAQKEIMKGDKYSKLNLVEVAYGDDEYQKSVDQTQALLQNYPNLKVICAPTTVGIAAASKVITDAGLQGKVIVTGLGLPSEMAEFMGAGNVACPYMFLWNPIDVGRVAAYALVEMVNGKLTGELGQSFTAANGTTYTVTEAGDGGTEIIIGPPFAFTADNIAEWKTVY